MFNLRSQFIACPISGCYFGTKEFPFSVYVAASFRFYECGLGQLGGAFVGLWDVSFRLEVEALKFVLRVWNKEVFRNVFENVRQAESSLKQLELTYDQTNLDSDLIALNSAQANLLRAMSEEDDFQKQKERMKWL